MDIKANKNKGNNVMKRVIEILLANLMIFTILSISVFAAPPTVSAEGWPVVTTSSASLYGYINANQGLNIRQSGFEYKQSSSSTWIICYIKIPINADDRDIRYTLTGLQSGTSYNYRAFATNVNNETGYSPTVTFTTTKATLGNVTITAPTEGSTWSKDSPPVIKWNSVTNATSYSIAIRNVTTNVLLKTATNIGNVISYTITTAEKNALIYSNQYRISIEAVNPSYNSGWGERLFYISAATPIINSFTTNKTQYNIGEAVNFSGSATNFASWKIVWLKGSTEEAATSIQNNTSISYSATVNSTVYTGAKLYVYSGSNGSGTVVTKDASFTVSKPTLGNVTITAPTEGSTWSKDSPPVIRWNPVANATGYSIAIRNVTANVLLKTATNIGNV